MNALALNTHSRAKAAHRAEVPVGTNSRAALLIALGVASRFPDYFGRDWDALDECICDLSWLPDGDVILTHADMPVSDDRASLSTYLSILNDGVEKLTATGNRKLLVIFPPDMESAVQTALTDT